MARKDQALALLRQGLPPSQIAEQMHASPATVMQYLCLKIGEGELRRSDVAFSISREAREAIEQGIEATGSMSAYTLARELHKKGLEVSRADVSIYLNYRRARVVLGDMYELVRSIEVRLHRFVKDAFISEYGEENWWRGGVPDVIRAECAALLEKDPDPADHPYRYTHLISLREIFDKRWNVLLNHLPENFRNQKKELLERMLKLNRIRNGVMHPVRNTVFSEDEFLFVRELESDLADFTVTVQPIPENADAASPSETTMQTAETRQAPPEAAPITQVLEREHETQGTGLVTKLAPVDESRPAPESALTSGQAHDEHGDEFVPTIKSA